MYMRWKFTFLLAAVVVLLILHPAGDQSDALGSLYKAIFILVYAAAFFVLFQRGRSRMAAVLLGIPTVGGVMVHFAIPQSSPIVAAIVLHGLPVLFLGYTAFIVLRTIFRQSVVTFDAINGAFAGYLFLGVAFGHLYCLLDTIVPNSFRYPPDPGAPAGSAARFGMLTYFSLVTLTTVGYGDITPRSGWARNIAVVEAIMGQFYLAVIVAELISVRVALALSERHRARNETPADKQ